MTETGANPIDSAKSSPPSIGLGILSWRGHRSLEQALKSYANEDLFSLFDDSMIFLPDPDDNVRRVAKHYPLRIETDSQNLGILNGMEEISNRLTTDYIFFTENDCPLVETRAEAKRQIEIAINILENDDAMMARMRSIKNPGETFDILGKYNRYFPQKKTLASTFRRALRPGKAKRLTGGAIYAEQKPDLKFPKYITNVGDGFYLVNSAIMPWTNQSILMKRSVFRDSILPYCKAAPLRRTINGFRNLEIELNQSKFWTKPGRKIACGPGLLTHKRANDRGY